MAFVLNFISRAWHVPVLNIYYTDEQVFQCQSGYTEVKWRKGVAPALHLVCIGQHLGQVMCNQGGTKNCIWNLDLSFAFTYYLSFFVSKYKDSIMNLPSQTYEH